MNSHFESWSPNGFLNIQRVIAGVKKFIRLKIYLYHWKDLGMYMSQMGSHDPFGYLKHKLWPKERLKVKLLVGLPTSKNREFL
jgi:hypothetical protein